MSVRQLDPFRLTFYQVSIENWSEKKKKLLDLVDWDDEECLMDDFFSDYYKNIYKNNMRAPYHEDFVNILKKDLNQFVYSVESSPLNRYKHNLSMEITNLWAQRYVDSQHMPPHTHEPAGFSAVLYAEFDGDYHEATKFWAPFKNTIDAMDYRFDPQVKEGDIIFFPSFLLHYATPNESDKRRTIFSFNSVMRPTK